MLGGGGEVNCESGFDSPHPSCRDSGESNPMNRYFIDVRHDGLKKYRRITGSDPYVVEQKAHAQVAAWEQEWQRIKGKEEVHLNKQTKKELAIQETRKAKAAL